MSAAVIDGPTLRCQVTGSIEPLLHALANAGVQELLSTSGSKGPDLIQPFLKSLRQNIGRGSAE